jgi:hypothetical protein
MSETYASGGYARHGTERAGGVILVVVSCLSAVLVIAGLIYATGTGVRHNAAVLAASCEPSLFISGLPCTSQQMVISQYEATVNPAIKQLTADTAAYRINENRHLVAAEAALTAEVSTEQALDNSLAAMTFTPENRARADRLITGAEMNGNPVPSAAITFTPKMTVIADALIQADQALATLTVRQARSASLIRLRSFNARAEAAGAAVQNDMKLLRQAINAPLATN